MEFPYLQSARAVYLKGLYNKDSFRYNGELKKTAAYTTDRTVLFEFITSEEFRSIDYKQLEANEKAVAAIEVTEEITVAPTPVIVEEPQLKADPTPLSSIEKLERSIKMLIKEPETITPIVPEETIPAEEVSAPIEITEPEPTPVAETATEITISPEPIGSPLKFEQSEKHSFAEWLQLSRLKPIDRTTPAPESEATPIEEKAPEPPTALDKKLELIDRFIEASPKITPVKTDTSAWENLSKKTGDTPGLMTETLARVYLEQKKYAKAIQAYEILILKYPEKSAFFADRILEIKDLQQNNN